MSSSGAANSVPPGAGRFATTHWSVVRAAGRPKSAHYREALEKLCQTYWFALYSYMRRHGYKSHEAEDYAQAFFARLLEKEGLRLADPKLGKFRSFLLASLKNFLANERDRLRAQKRGGGRKILSLDVEHAENRYTLEPADRLSPEKLYERSWAMTVLEGAMGRLGTEADSMGKRGVFDHLKTYLTAAKSSVPYKDVAARLDMTEGAVKVAVHRLRRRYRELLRDEIAQTVVTEEQIDEEIRDLFAALAH
ncbi:MAG: sigma-70 family RNA polymerase sigma factor [Phycisphaerales bacterium]|nr:MAG: sigma-70 family RNA polymerase sigma factor [Phycisphaerales bacterium]